MSSYPFPVRNTAMANNAINDHDYAIQLYESWFEGTPPSNRTRLLMKIGAFNRDFPEERTHAPGSGAVKRPGYDGTDMGYSG
jgi:hypothetical protein